MTDDERAIYKDKKLKEIRDYHSDLIKDLGVSIYDFNMKTKFLDDRGRFVVGIFASEFKKQKGFYFELIDSNLNPVDSERKVYKIPFTTSFEEEYELNTKGSYHVPLDELRVVHPASVAISKSSAFTAVDEVLNSNESALSKVQRAPALMEDCPYSEMTIRDYFAIHTGRPVSAKNWLNDLIKNK
jgi:hypothetical protein